MHRIYVLVFTALVALFGCASTQSAVTTGASARALSPIQQVATAANTSGITKEEDVFIEKMLIVEMTLCQMSYPAPKSNLDCLQRINKKLFEVWPNAKSDAMKAGLLPLPVADKETTELLTGAMSVVATCRRQDFDRCADDALHTVSSVFDPHTVYLNKEETRGLRENTSGTLMGIGLQLSGLTEKDDPLIVVEPLEGSPAEKAGIKAGDKIARVDGKPVELFGNISEAVQKIKGRPGTTVVLTIERDGGKPFDVSIVRAPIKTMSVKALSIKYGGARYGLLQVKNFDQGVCERAEKGYQSLANAPGLPLAGLIISFESNPGGLLDEAHCFLDLFTDATNFVLERTRTKVFAYKPQVNPWTGRRSVPSYPGDVTSGLPILALSDGASASASEIVLRGLQHSRRAVVAGTRSWGKGTVQTILPFDENDPETDSIKVTGAEYLIGTANDWVPVQCLGVTPDIPFDRGFDPKDKDGNPVRECELGGSIASGGPMPNAPTERPFTARELSRANIMLDAYKDYLVVNKVDDKRRTLVERLKKQQEKLDFKKGK